jgi:hypothetical protein
VWYNDDKMIKRISEHTLVAAAVIQKYNLSPVYPPVEEPPNEPTKPPVEEPGDPFKKPPIPEIPPVEEPWDVPREPPVKEPPPEDPDQIPPQPHTSRLVHNRRAANTACTL